MKTLQGRSLSAAASEVALDRPRLVFGVAVQTMRRPDRLVFGLPLSSSVIGLVVGGAALLANGFDAFAVPALGLLALGVLIPLSDLRRRAGSWDRSGSLLLGLSLAAIVLLLALPEFLFGWQLNGVIHRSVISAPLLLMLSVLTASYAFRSLLGDTPTAQDLSLYPLLALPVVLALVAYALLLGPVIGSGVGGLSLDLLMSEYRADFDPQTAAWVYQAGLRNHILGTGLLVLMTSFLAILPGVGAGLFMSEYPGRLANLVTFCATMLRAMSVFIIGVTALGLVGLVPEEPGNLASDLIRGSYVDKDGFQIAGTGSFLTASLFLAMLVIPTIARLTEEGLRSVPREIREGSIALGATEGYGMRRILLPWAGPNIVTGLLLGAAEAIGSLAILVFIAGTGQSGLGPTSEVTSLDFALFATKYGPKQFQDVMVSYQFTIALLLLFLTLGLTIVATLLRRRFTHRYRGTLT